MDYLIHDGYSDRFNAAASDGISAGPRYGPLTIPGGNDPAANYSITANAILDRELLEEAETAGQSGGSDMLLYKPLNTSDEKYMWAYKGLFACQIQDKDNNAFAPRQDQEYSVEWDMVRYVSWLNGLLARGEKLHRLINRIVVLGLVETDLKGGPSRRPGSQVSNNLILSGKQSIFNTGYEDITAGDLVYITLPQITKDGRLLQGGSARVPHMPSGLAPLITTPYNHRNHKGSGKLLFEALTAGFGGSDQAYADQTEENAKHFMRAMNMVAMVAIRQLAQKGQLGNFQWNANTAKALMQHMSNGDMADNDSFMHEFAKGILTPHDAPLFPSQKPDMNTIKQAREDAIAQKEHVNMRLLADKDILGGNGNSDFMKWLNLAQIRTYPEAYASISDQENAVRGRIVCKAFTTASPGFTFDGLVFIGGTSSL